MTLYGLPRGLSRARAVGVCKLILAIMVAFPNVQPMSSIALAGCDCLNCLQPQNSGKAHVCKVFARLLTVAKSR